MKKGPSWVYHFNKCREYVGCAEHMELCNNLAAATASFIFFKLRSFSPFIFHQKLSSCFISFRLEFLSKQFQRKRENLPSATHCMTSLLHAATWFSRGARFSSHISKNSLIRAVNKLIRLITQNMQDKRNENKNCHPHTYEILNSFSFTPAIQHLLETVLSLAWA